MNKLQILFKKDVPEYDYIINQIKTYEHLLIKEVNYIKYDKISVESSQSLLDTVCRITSEAIYAFFKFRVLDLCFKDINLHNYDKYALIGALLSVDKENEKKQIYNTIINLKIISLESLMDFRLARLLKSWNELAELAYKLSKEVNNREELYELISYFISGIEKQSRVTITDTNPINLAIDGNVLSPIAFTSDHDINLLITVISEGPSHLIIKNQDILSKKLLDTFRALGQ